MPFGGFISILRFGSFVFYFTANLLALLFLSAKGLFISSFFHVGILSTARAQIFLDLVPIVLQSRHSDNIAS